MTVKGSLSATLVSRVYLGLLGLLMMPMYMRLLGPEAYGLVALFSVLQMWFQLLDIGLVPTMARETARFRAGALGAMDFRLLMRALEGLFLLVAGLAATTLFVSADAVTRYWLKSERLAPQEVEACLRMMAVCIGLRLLGELYRGVVSGFERFRWLAGYNVVFGSVRMVLVVPLLAWTSGGPTQFFAFQLTVMTGELLVLGVMAYRLAPSTGPRPLPWRATPLRGVLSFSVVLSLASIVWMTLSQLDKLLLSGLLPLDNYGVFSLAVAAAASVLLVSGALTDVLMPRLTHLRAQDAHEALTTLYRDATQWAGICAWSIAFPLAMHAERVMMIWTGDAVLAARTAPVLAYYALGNAALTVGAFPYYLQFAEGRLRLHLIGTGIMAALLVPSLWWASVRYGGVGAAAVWLGVNLLYLIMWTPLAHAHFLPGLHKRWMLQDVLPVGTLAGIAALACRSLPFPTGRLASALMLIVVALVVLASATAGSSWARAHLRPTAGTGTDDSDRAHLS